MKTTILLLCFSFVVLFSCTKGATGPEVITGPHGDIAVAFSSIYHGCSEGSTQYAMANSVSLDSNSTVTKKSRSGGRTCTGSKKVSAEEFYELAFLANNADLDNYDEPACDEDIMPGSYICSIKYTAFDGSPHTTKYNCNLSTSVSAFFKRLDELSDDIKSECTGEVE